MDLVQPVGLWTVRLSSGAQDLTLSLLRAQSRPRKRARIWAVGSKSNRPGGPVSFAIAWRRGALGTLGSRSNGPQSRGCSGLRSDRGTVTQSRPSVSDLTVRVARKWDGFPNVSGESSPSVLIVRFALSGFDSVHLTHRPRRSRLARWQVGPPSLQVVFFLAPAPARVLRHYRAAGALTGAFSTHCFPPGRFPLITGHVTAPGALSHSPSTCLSWP